MNININDIKNGMTIIMDNNLYQIIEFQHVKPGKGSAFVRMKLRNLRTGSITEDTYNTNIKIEKAHIDRVPMQFLYAAGDNYVFMNNDTYEQVEISTKTLKDQINFIKEGMEITIDYYEGEILGITLPEKVEYEVIETEPAVRGNTTNNAQKLAEQTRTANNKNIIVYDRIKKFAMNIPDDWSGKVEFQGVLSSLSKLEEISASRKLSLNKEEKSQVELEMIKLDDAIYDFFKANEDKVKDSELLSKVINTDNFSLISPNEAILNSDSKYIDDNAMVWYIASRAAVRASDFYSEYRTIISDKIAPIPTQELATYLGYASILNGGVIDNFCNAVNTSLKKWAEPFKNDDELQESTRYTDDKGNSYKVEHISKDFILDSSVSPRFSRVTFIEGIPGSGKTTGVFNNIIVLLKKYHPEVLKSVWIGHATEESAGNLKKDLNLDSAVALDKNKLMTKVSTEWKSFESYKKDANVTLMYSLMTIT